MAGGARGTAGADVREGGNLPQRGEPRGEDSGAVPDYAGGIALAGARIRRGGLS